MSQRSAFAETWSGCSLQPIGLQNLCPQDIEARFHVLFRIADILLDRGYQTDLFDHLFSKATIEVTYDQRPPAFPLAQMAAPNWIFVRNLAHSGEAEIWVLPNRNTGDFTAHLVLPDDYDIVCSNCHNVCQQATMHQVDGNAYCSICTAPVPAYANTIARFFETWCESIMQMAGDLEPAIWKKKETMSTQQEKFDIIVETVGGL